MANAAYLHRSLGMAQGFELYDDRIWRRLGSENVLYSWLKLSPYTFEGLQKSYRSASSISDTAIRWLSSTDARPFFLFLNYMDPHAPYYPPAPFDTRFEGRDLFLASPRDAILFGERGIESREQRHFDAVYDGEISYVDRELGRVVAELERTGRYDSTMLIVTSDHGEFFGEHDLWEHAVGPFDEVHHVPLLIKFPRSRAAGRVKTWMGLTDVFPTILSTLEIEIPEGLDGRAFPSEGGPIVIEQRPNTNLFRTHGERFARGYIGLYRHPWKLVRYSDGSRSLFNLASDPAETQDVLAIQRDVARDLEAELNTYEASIVPGPEKPSFDSVGQETRERLRSLGYLR